MDPILQQEVSGRPVAVVLGGEEYPLEFSIHAVILYKQITGDNLFDGTCWSKIAPLVDPERFIACLWAGLHQYADDKWSVPFTRPQLEKLVDFANVNPTCEAVTRALVAQFPKAKEASPGETSSGESMLPAQVEAGSTAESRNSGPLPPSI